MNLRTLVITCLTSFLLNTCFSQFNFDDSLVAYYPFSGNGNDSSGNGYNGVLLNGGAYDFGYNHVGTGLKLDGIDDYFRVIGLTTNFEAYTISAWVMEIEEPNVPDDDGLVLGTFIEQTSGDTISAYGLHVVDDTIGSRHYNASRYLKGAVMDSPYWKLVTCTWDGQVFSQYIDQFLTDTVHMYSIEALTGEFIIGAQRDAFGITNFHEGYIDEVRIYNRALSPCEIRELYRGIGSTIGNPLSYNQFGYLVCYDQGTEYDWVYCDSNYQQIPGALNQQTYQPQVNGNYAVIIHDGGCVDTTACYYVDDVSLNEIGINFFEVFPNPTSTYLNINGPENVSFVGSEYYFTDAFGKVVLSGILENSEKIDVTDLTNGFYFLNVNGFKQRLVIDR